MFFKKICRIFHQKKSNKAKKVQSNSSQNVVNDPPFNDERIQTPPKFTKLNRLHPTTTVTKNVAALVDNDENEYSLTKTLPKFRSSAKWRSSKPFAQNAMRYKFYPKRSHRFNSSRSTNASKIVSMNPQ
uniref:Uncharacterized protein n=1 Tax=Panagrolaimus davidi TaxID=227884 RepID=A0A914PTJ8_9BILA